MKNCNEYSKKSRPGKFSGVCFAAALAVSVTPSLAQDTFEFEDPLADMRAQVEQIETGKAPAADGQTAFASVDGESASAPPAVKDPLSRISDRLGLPVLGLVALAGLALLAFLLGLMWFVTRLTTRRSPSSAERGNYDDYEGAPARRELENDRRAARNIAPTSRSMDYDKAAVPSAAMAAAAVISDDDAPDLGAYDLTDTQIHAHSIGTDAAISEHADQVAETAPEDTDAADPKSWRRPNLDRLKASIRRDWQDGKDEQAAGAEISDTKASDRAPAGDGDVEAEFAVAIETAAKEDPSPLRREAENFADLFGGDDGAAVTSIQNEDTMPSFFSDGVGSSQNHDANVVSDLRSVTAEKTADITSSETFDRRRAELPSRDDAMRRIRALREAVKAS